MSTRTRPLVAIPARLNSSRLPRKALIDIHGAPLISRVFRRVSAHPDVAQTVVCTDSREIQALISQEGGEAILSSALCESGTERVARGAQALMSQPELQRLLGEWDQRWVINVQGDEPLLPLESLTQLINSLEGWRARGARVVTLACHEEGEEAQGSIRFNPSVVKLCVREDMRALFFSRADIGAGHALRHIGVYAFHTEVLETLLSPRSALSRVEDLEQLTWMERGEEIGVELVQPHPKGIDTPEDLERVRSLLSSPLEF